MNDRLFSYLDSQTDEMIAFLRTLLSFDSVAEQGDASFPHGKSVADCLNAALEYAEALGLHTRNAEGHAGLIELDTKTPKIGVLCHLDVVPAGDGWVHPPFDGAIENGCLYGRGTTDDKGPFVSALFALAALKHCDIPLRYGIRLIAGTCEETGSADIAYCKKQGLIPPYVFSPDANFPVVNTEKGIAHGSFYAPIARSALTELSAGEVINMVPQSATATLDGEVFSFSGTCAHASLPENGDNALTKLFAALKDRDPLLSEAAALFPHGEVNGAALGIDQSEPIAGPLTFSLNLASVKDGMLCLSFDIRYPLCTDGPSLQKAIEARLADSPFSLADFSAMEPHHVEEESPFVQTLLASYAEVSGNEPYCIAIGGGTYVHDIDGGVAFGTVYPNDDCRIHSADEFVRVEELLQNAKIFAAALAALQKAEL